MKFVMINDRRCQKEDDDDDCDCVEMTLIMILVQMKLEDFLESLNHIGAPVNCADVRSGFVRLSGLFSSASGPTFQS